MAAEGGQIPGRDHLGGGRFAITVDHFHEIEREGPLDLGRKRRVGPGAVISMGRDEHFARAHEVVSVHQSVDDRSVIAGIRQLADP